MLRASTESEAPAVPMAIDEYTVNYIYYILYTPCIHLSHLNVKGPEGWAYKGVRNLVSRWLVRITLPTPGLYADCLPEWLTN